MKWQVSGNEQLTNKQTIDRNPVNLMKNMQHVNMWISCLLLFSIKSNGKWNIFALLARKSISVICDFMTFHFKWRPTYHSLNGSN